MSLKFAPPYRKLSTLLAIPTATCLMPWAAALPKRLESPHHFCALWNPSVLLSAKGKPHLLIEQTYEKALLLGQQPLQLAVHCHWVPQILGKQPLGSVQLVHRNRCLKVAFAQGHHRTLQLFQFHQRQCFFKQLNFSLFKDFHTGRLDACWIYQFSQLRIAQYCPNLQLHWKMKNKMVGRISVQLSWAKNHDAAPWNHSFAVKQMLGMLSKDTIDTTQPSKSKRSDDSDAQVSSGGDESHNLASERKTDTDSSDAAKLKGLTSSETEVTQISTVADSNSGEFGWSELDTKTNSPSKPAPWRTSVVANWGFDNEDSELASQASDDLLETIGWRAGNNHGVRITHLEPQVKALQARTHANEDTVKDEIAQLQQKIGALESDLQHTQQVAQRRHELLIDSWGFQCASQEYQRLNAAALQNFDPKALEKSFGHFYLRNLKPVFADAAKHSWEIFHEIGTVACQLIEHWKIKNLPGSKILPPINPQNLNALLDQLGSAGMNLADADPSLLNSFLAVTNRPVPILEGAKPSIRLQIKPEADLSALLRRDIEKLKHIHETVLKKILRPYALKLYREDDQINQETVQMREAQLASDIKAYLDKSHAEFEKNGNYLMLKKTLGQLDANPKSDPPND